MSNAGLEKVQAGIKIARRNINNLRYADDTTLMAKTKEKLKSLLTKIKVDREMLGWKKHKLKSKLLGETSITSDMQMTPLLRQKVKRN